MYRWNEVQEYRSLFQPAKYVKKLWDLLEFTHNNYVKERNLKCELNEISCQDLHAYPKAWCRPLFLRHYTECSCTQSFIPTKNLHKLHPSHQAVTAVHDSRHWPTETREAVNQLWIPFYWSIQAKLRYFLEVSQHWTDPIDFHCYF